MDGEGAAGLSRCLLFCGFCAFSRPSQRSREAEDRAAEFKNKAAGEKQNGREKAQKAQKEGDLDAGDREIGQPLCALGLGARGATRPTQDPS
jgi:hypothetical protein